MSLACAVSRATFLHDVSEFRSIKQHFRGPQGGVYDVNVVFDSCYLRNLIYFQTVSHHGIDLQSSGLAN